MNNIIFLDFDGVFILNDDISLYCVKNINKIIRETNSKIVISSDWRKHHTTIDIEKLFLKWGLKGEIIGITNNHWVLGSHLSYIEKYRRDEINEYILENKIKNYIIIDDLELYNGYYGEKNDNFFQTLFYKGITDDITLKIIKKLNNIKKKR